MVTIKNSQRKIKISEKKVREYTEKVLEILKYKDFDIGIWFTTNQTIAKYNKKYRKKDKPTDILSFPFHTGLKPKEKIKPKAEDEKNLGDIIISAEYAKKDAKKFNRNFSEHLKILLVHGICHLIGYTHKTESEYKKMLTKEKDILSKLS